MQSKAKRKIVHIDEEKCDGCGLCVPSCAEGAIKVINGKAKLMADNLCDGLGACLGHCPQGAIHIEEREAEGFDHQAVERHLKAAVQTLPQTAPMPAAPHQGGGCPGSRMRMLRPQATSAGAAIESRASRLGQWPVQLALVPATGRMWEEAEVLIAADCVPFAYPDFNERMLAGKSLAIACPKLDNVQPYLEKLATIFASNSIRSVTVVHMEVPCCMGLVRLVQMAMMQSGAEIPVQTIVVGIDGQLRNA